MDKIKFIMDNFAVVIGGKMCYNEFIKDEIS